MWFSAKLSNGVCTFIRVKFLPVLDLERSAFDTMGTNACFTCDMYHLKS